MLKIVYAFFVAILLAIFVAVGISTFYAEPTPPTYPSITRPVVGPDDAQVDPKYIEAQEKAYNEEYEKYNKDVSAYNRNVSIIALVAAVIFLVVGLVIAPKIHVLSDGLLLGGVFTLMYSLVRGFIAEENTYRFIVVSIGLVVVLALGYIKFIKPENAKAAGKNKK